MIDVYTMTYFDINILIKRNENVWIKSQKLFLPFAFVTFWLLYTQWYILKWIIISYIKKCLIKIHRILSLHHLWSTLITKQIKDARHKKSFRIVFKSYMYRNTMYTTKCRAYTTLYVVQGVYTLEAAKRTSNIDFYLIS